MAVHDYVVANGTGQAVRQDLNNALAAIVSNNSSSSEPGTTYAYQWWADTNANVLKIRNSANDGWITLRELDGTMLIEDGDASTPGLAFADDVNTGIFSPAADQIGFATGGTERFRIETGEVVVNDPSNNVDFRVESDSNTHMLFVDAGNDRIGINNSSPSQLLHITSSGEGQIRFADGSRATALGSTGSIGFVGSLTASNGFAFYSANTEQARIDSNGRLLVGASSSRTVGGNIAGKLQIEGTGTGGSTTACTVTQNSDDSTGGRLMLAKSRGTSNGSITLVQSGDQLGMIDFAGADGTNAGSSAVRIIAEVDGTPGENDMPGRLEFHTTADGASSPTERVRIDSSGRLLIGATSPAVSSLNANLEVRDTSVPEFIFSRNDTSIVTNNCLGRIRWYGNDDDGTYEEMARFGAHADGTHSSTSKPGRMLFGTTAPNATSPTDRFLIDSLGRIDQFASNDAAFDLHFAQTASTEVAFRVRKGATDLTDGTVCMRILADGDLENTNNNYGAISDEKLKENIVDASSQWEDIKDLRVRNYNFKESTNYGTHTQIGVVAQEVEAVSPGLVTSNPDRDDDGNDLGTVTKSVNYSVLYMKAVKALQEAMNRIETLEAKVAALEAG